MKSLSNVGLADRRSQLLTRLASRQHQHKAAPTCGPSSGEDKVKIKRAKNRCGYAATFRGIKIQAGDMDEIYIRDDRALAEGRLQTLARLVEAMPPDLHKEIRSIDYSKGNWPPDPYWFPGYLIWANPELIRDAHERQRLSDLFLRVDGGHPGIGWMRPTTPWVNRKPQPALPELHLGDEMGLWIKPIGWGAEFGGCHRSERLLPSFREAAVSRHGARNYPRPSRRAG
jgi:hypothetical protein